MGGPPGARREAASVVARYQQMGAGMWLLCPCRSVNGRNAVLVPVAQTHIRRHEDERWPSHHAPCCDFYRDPAEQNLIPGSYVGSVERPLHLARRFGRQSKGWIGALSQTLTQIAGRGSRAS